MPATERTGEIRAMLFVRENLPTPATRSSQTIIARLERLEADGLLGEYGVTSWAKRLPLDASGPKDQRDRYNEFSDWARERGVRLTPFFDTRECYSMETGKKRTELVFPAICLAVYEGDDLETLAPHADGDETTSVNDSLDLIAELSGERRPGQTVLTAD